MSKIKIEYKNAFAVRFPNTLSTNALAFLEMTEAAAKKMPRFKVEGVNRKMGNLYATEETPVAHIVTGGNVMEVGTGTLKVRNLMGIGTDSKLDVAYVAESDLRVSPNFTVVPIYNVDLHLTEIKARFRAFLYEVYGIVEAPKVVVVSATPSPVAFSNFVKVGTSRIDRDDLATLAAALGASKPAKKREVRVTYPGIHGLNFSI